MEASRFIKKNILYILPFGVLLLIIAIINFANNKQFWEASLIEVLNIFVLVILSCFLIEYRKDIMEKKNILKSILDEIQQLITKIELSVVNDNFVFNIFLIDSRAIQNDCTILKSACTYLKIERDVDYIKTEIEELHQYLSEKNDQGGIQKNDQTAIRHCKNIQFGVKKVISQLFF